MFYLKFYTVHEVAKMLEVSIETVRRYIKSGKLQAFKMGKAYKITQEQVNKALEQSKVN